jgi:hypothetical protein
VRISVLRAAESRYGLKLLNLLGWRGVHVEQVVTFTDFWGMRFRWARRLARFLGWGGVAVYLVQRQWHSPFRGQGFHWRGRALLRVRRLLVR